MDSKLVLAALDTYYDRYNRLVPDTYKNKYNDFYSNKLPDGLVCYGAEMVRNSLGKKHKELHIKATDKMRQVRKWFPKEKSLFVDSGGFQIVGGRFPTSYIDILADRYTDFIASTDDLDNMLYFYLDVAPVSLDRKEAMSKMEYFHKTLMEKTKQNKQHEKVYYVHHCNNPRSYEMFNTFRTKNKILEELNSHRHAVGGMVALNFNDPNLTCRPYIIPLFNIIDEERDYLNSGGQVWYHILGTSSIVDMFLFAWIEILSDLNNWNLTITFDSTSSLNNAIKSGILHKLEKDGSISIIKTKKNDLVNKYRIDAFNEVFEEMKNVFDLPYTITNENAFIESSPGVFRWDSNTTHSLCVYEYYAFGQIFEYIKDYFKDKHDLIINPTSELLNTSLKLLSKIEGNEETSGKRSGKDLRRFLPTIFNPLLNSLDIIKKIIDGKTTPQMAESIVSLCLRKYEHFFCKNSSALSIDNLKE